MSDTIASHSEDTPQDDYQTAVTDAFAAFGLDTPSDSAGSSESQQDTLDVEQSNPPAKEETTPAKTIKVKHNKEEIEVDVSDDKLPEYVQKALALDKVRGKQTELEKNLERAAKLNGFDKTEDYLANLDRLEQEAQQRQQDQFKDMRAQLREDAEIAGLDPDRVDAWLDNHPLLQEANKAIQAGQKNEQERVKQEIEQQSLAKWNELYEAYPDLVESSKAFEDEGAPEWFTPEMQAKINRGYDPIDAYESAHKSNIIRQSKEQGKRQAIKEQRLGLRSQVETESSADLEPEVPDGLASAFSLFGLPKESAKKYVKK
jgi:hypothetical protein